jgi:hypothetical protein
LIERFFVTDLAMASSRASAACARI